MEAKKVMRKAWILAAVCALAALSAPATYAAPPCPGPTPMSNLNAAPIINCPDGRPVQAYAWQINNAMINTGNNDIVCEVNGGSACTTMPGSNDLGDNKVGIETDWLNNGTIGCPTGRVVISVICNNGAGSLLSVSGACPEYGYNPELAHPLDEFGNFGPLDFGPAPTLNPVLTSGRPKVSQFTRDAAGDHVLVQADPVTIQSDCTPGSVGEALVGAGVCADLGCGGFAPTTAPGNVYVSNQVCGTGTKVDTRRRNFCSAPASRFGEFCDTLGTNTAQCGTGGVCSAPPAAWRSGSCVGGPTPAALCNTASECGGGTCQPFGNAAGDVPVNVRSPLTGTCNYIGTTSIVNGIETGGITGYVEVTTAGNPNASSPLAEGLGVGKKGGSIELNFHTSSELGLAGFNVYAVGKQRGEIKLNAGLIGPKGVGGAGASYTLTFAMSELKGNRSLVVESVLMDGTTVRAPRIDF